MIAPFPSPCQYVHLQRKVEFLCILKKDLYHTKVCSICLKYTESRYGGRRAPKSFREGARLSPCHLNFLSSVVVALSMAPANKARAAGVSASSFLDLKAELSKKEEQFAQDKVAGKNTSLIGSVKRPDKVRT